MPASDMRKFNKGPRSLASSDVWTQPSQRCDAFLSFMYEHMAEPFAEVEACEDNPSLAFTTLVVLPDDEVVGKDGALDNPLSQWCTSISNREIRHIGYTTIPDIYETFGYWLNTTVGLDEGEQIPSIKTFRRVLYHWSPVLKIRALGTHARCILCAEITEALQKEADR